MIYDRRGPMNAVSVVSRTQSLRVCSERASGGRQPPVFSGSGQGADAPRSPGTDLMEQTLSHVSPFQRLSSLLAAVYASMKSENPGLGGSPERSWVIPVNPGYDRICVERPWGDITHCISISSAI